MRDSTGGLNVRSAWGRGGGDARTEQLRSQYTAGKRVRWCEIQTKWRSSVVGEQSPNCIPIVGSAKSLVPSDKRFNHTKVWCTFIFIDLQATGDCKQRIYILYVGRQINPLS